MKTTTRNPRLTERCLRNLVGSGQGTQAQAERLDRMESCRRALAEFDNVGNRFKQPGRRGVRAGQER